MKAARALRNVAASIRQRLLDLTRAGEGNFQDYLDRYAVERLIYRLSLSEARERFLLKGALLFTAWFEVPHRPTRDADFLGLGEPDAEKLTDMLHALCNVAADDGNNLLCSPKSSGSCVLFEWARGPYLFDGF